MGLLEVPVLLLGKTIGAFLPVIKDRASQWIYLSCDMRTQFAALIFYLFYPKKMSIKVTKPLSP